MWSCFSRSFAPLKNQLKTDCFPMNFMIPKLFPKLLFNYDIMAGFAVWNEGFHNMISWSHKKKEILLQGRLGLSIEESLPPTTAVEVIESVCVSVCLCVCVCVCLSELSWLNRLTYEHDFWYGDVSRQYLGHVWLSRSKVKVTRLKNVMWVMLYVVLCGCLGHNHCSQ